MKRDFLLILGTLLVVSTLHGAWLNGWPWDDWMPMDSAPRYADVPVEIRCACGFFPWTETMYWAPTVPGCFAFHLSIQPDPCIGRPAWIHSTDPRAYIDEREVGDSHLRWRPAKE